MLRANCGVLINMHHINITTTTTTTTGHYYYYYYYIITTTTTTFMQGIYNYTLYITHETNHVSTVKNVAATQ
jgi:hypothetical protein